VWRHLHERVLLPVQVTLRSITTTSATLVDGSISVSTGKNNIDCTTRFVRTKAHERNQRRAAAAERALEIGRRRLARSGFGSCRLGKADALVAVVKDGVVHSQEDLAHDPFGPQPIATGLVAHETTDAYRVGDLHGERAVTDGCRRCRPACAAECSPCKGQTCCRRAPNLQHRRCTSAPGTLSKSFGMPSTLQMPFRPMVHGTDAARSAERRLTQAREGARLQRVLLRRERHVDAADAEHDVWQARQPRAVEEGLLRAERAGARAAGLRLRADRGVYRRDCGRGACDEARACARALRVGKWRGVWANGGDRWQGCDWATEPNGGYRGADVALCCAQALRPSTLGYACCTRAPAKRRACMAAHPCPRSPGSRLDKRPRTHPTATPPAPRTASTLPARDRPTSARP
jgi:hypothetical protein